MPPPSELPLAQDIHQQHDKKLFWILSDQNKKEASAMTAARVSIS